MTVAELVTVVGALLESLKPIFAITITFVMLVRGLLGALGM